MTSPLKKTEESEERKKKRASWGGGLERKGNMTGVKGKKK